MKHLLDPLGPVRRQPAIGPLQGAGTAPGSPPIVNPHPDRAPWSMLPIPPAPVGWPSLGWLTYGEPCLTAASQTESVFLTGVRAKLLPQLANSAHGQTSLAQPAGGGELPLLPPALPLELLGVVAAHVDDERSLGSWLAVNKSHYFSMQGWRAIRSFEALERDWQRMWDIGEGERCMEFAQASYGDGGIYNQSMLAPLPVELRILVPLMLRERILPAQDRFKYAMELTRFLNGIGPGRLTQCLRWVTQLQDCRLVPAQQDPIYPTLLKINVKVSEYLFRHPVAFMRCVEATMDPAQRLVLVEASLMLLLTCPSYEFKEGNFLTKMAASVPKCKPAPALHARLTYLIGMLNHQFHPGRPEVTLSYFAQFASVLETMSDSEQASLLTGLARTTRRLADQQWYVNTGRVTLLPPERSTYLFVHRSGASLVNHLMIGCDQLAIIANKDCTSGSTRVKLLLELVPTLESEMQAFCALYEVACQIGEPTHADERRLTKGIVLAPVTWNLVPHEGTLREAFDRSTSPPFEADAWSVFQHRTHRLLSVLRNAAAKSPWSDDLVNGPVLRERLVAIAAQWPLSDSRELLVAWFKR